MGLGRPAEELEKPGGEFAAEARETVKHAFANFAGAEVGG